MIFSKENCPFAAKVKELFTSINEKFASIELDKLGKLIDRRHHELQLA